MLSVCAQKYIQIQTCRFPDEDIVWQETLFHAQFSEAALLVVDWPNHGPGVDVEQGASRATRGSKEHWKAKSLSSWFMMLRPAVPGLQFVREHFRLTPLCRSSVTWQQTFWDIPMRIIVLGACRIEWTFSLHHMDRVLVIPTFTTNRKVHLRVTRKAYPISVSSSTSSSSGLGLLRKTIKIYSFISSQ